MSALSAILRTTALAFVTLQAVPTFAQQGDVNLYTTREPGLVKPLLEAFTKQSGIRVNTVFVKDGLAERVRAEGARSPADVLMTVDIGNLLQLVDQKVTQKLDSPVLNAAIPANLRDKDGHWYALSLRARVIYAAKSLNLKSITYEDLADPKWKGKLCIRSGQHPYNTALISAFIDHYNAQETEKWLRGLKDNLARTPGGGDRDVARDIVGGICSIGVANSYYVGLMRSGSGGPDQKRWGDGIDVVMPKFKNGGTHVNVSGAAIAVNAPNRANAVKLLEYLVSDEAQEIYGKGNYEYPVKPGAKIDPLIEALGVMKVDPRPVTQGASHIKAASELVDKVNFNK
jgi:iron(III) transport system substrate-binding protein